MTLEHDRALQIALGTGRKTKKWKNRTMLWSELLDHLSRFVVTNETVAQYKAMSRGQAEVKDVGGFVGGYCKDGSRKQVTSRSVLCLDADYADGNLWADWQLLKGEAAAIYSTHKHTPEAPRLRLVIPLARDVSPDEYAAIGRRVAADLGIDKFDDTTYAPDRLMYWPSAPEDGEYMFRYADEPFLDPDEVLATYPDWTDAALWPTTKPLEERARAKASKAEDPLEKRGIIGAFCRAHGITDVLEHILAGRYTATAQDDRYTFVGGSTTGGLVVYDDKFAYSHHATDPAGGQLCNAFDLVRLHLFPPGGTAPDGTHVGDEKDSVRRMQEYAAQDEATRRMLSEERRRQAAQEFGDLDNQEAQPSQDEHWQEKLEVDRQGKVRDTLGNLALILRNDPRLKDIAYNIHRSGIDIRRDAEGCSSVPWTPIKAGWNESDLGALQIYLEHVYGLYTPSKLKGILLAIAAERGYHPIRDYIESLPAWDGVPRVDTLFVDYLGAADTAYTRAVARKMMVAAVARVYRPGVKFDSVVVLNGPQGMGKSSFFARLGGRWFSDSLTIGDMKDKAAPEKLQGYWILELGELAGLKKVDVETVKAFITRQDDKFRHSYGYSVEDHPRQCIIVGSTNNGDGFLRDITGNRRFWPVTCTTSGKHRPWEVAEVVDQLWAEAYRFFQQGETLYLPPEIERMAEAEQTEALESDVREGMIAEYLEKLLPEDWDRMDLSERRGFLRGDPFTGGGRTGTVRRTVVSAVEIWAECFGKEPTAIRRSDTYDIFGMLMKIGGWEKYSGNRSASMKRAFYGIQRCFVRR